MGDWHRNASGGVKPAKSSALSKALIVFIVLCLIGTAYMLGATVTLYQVRANLEAPASALLR